MSDVDGEENQGKNGKKSGKKDLSSYSRINALQDDTLIRKWS